MSGSLSDRVEVNAERESSGGEARPAAGANPLAPWPPGAIVERGGPDMTLMLLILAAVVALVFTVRAVRRSGRV